MSPQVESSEEIARAKAAERYRERAERAEAKLDRVETIVDRWESGASEDGWALASRIRETLAR